jgi:YHS domain-containing protein
MVAFLRLLLFVLAAYVAFLFLRIYLGLKRGRPRTPARSPREAQGVMVKDDVCGTYIPRDEALTEVHGGEEHFFCSEECRRKFRSR